MALRKEPLKLTSEKILLGEEIWTIIWTRHAINRTYDRRSHPKVAVQMLSRTLTKLYTVKNISEYLDGCVVIRTFQYLGYFVLQFTRTEDGNFCYVKTYGDIGKFTHSTPGDKVITITEDNNVVFDTWAKKLVPVEKHAPKKVIGCISV